MGMQNGPLAADPIADFYRDKTVTFIVSTPPGGGYDIWGRLLARHLGRHIPGSPQVVVQNMVGAGGLRAATTLYNVSRRDGTVLGTVNSTAPFVPLFDPKAPKFDATRFGWIGSMTKETSFCVVWGTSPVKTFQDALTRRLIVGSTGPGSHMERYPLLMNALFGTKFEVISGYAGGNNVYLAMERGEVEGRCGITLPTLRNVHPHWLPEKKAHLIVQTGLERDDDPLAAKVPFLLELAKSDEHRRIMELVFANGQINVPIITPPEIPRERLVALRKAMAQASSDPALLEDARRQKLTPRYVSGEEAEALVKRIYATPASTVAAAIAATMRPK
jgi:tripartite-type tricarboxylate transporter receptor subunit TctC